MKTLYEAADAIEAHMLQDFLKQEGISTIIHGEYLRGAMGDLPANSMVRLVVDEADYVAARAIIEKWEAETTSETTTTNNGPPKQGQGVKSRAPLWLLIGLAIGTAATYAYFRIPYQQSGFDYNHDGRLDETWTYSAGRLPVKMESDRNLDSNVDVILNFDAAGISASGQEDNDFDGKFETETRYRSGVIEQYISDTDGDGYPDLRSNFINGVWVSTAYLDPKTGLRLREEHYKLGIITDADVDTDRDGVLDTRVIYSPLGEQVSTRKLGK